MTMRYRRKKDSTNAKCFNCDRPIWIRLGTYSMRAKHEHKNSGGGVESITFTLDKGQDLFTCNWCPQCVELGIIKYEAQSEKVSPLW